MYSVLRTKNFEKAFKKLQHSGHVNAVLRKEIECVILDMASNSSLAAHYRDHQLKGEMHQYRECHIRGDLLLIYEKREEILILVLINIGSHAQIFE